MRGLLGLIFSSRINYDPLKRRTLLARAQSLWLRQNQMLQRSLGLVVVVGPGHGVIAYMLNRIPPRPDTAILTPQKALIQALTAIREIFMILGTLPVHELLFKLFHTWQSPIAKGLVRHLLEEVQDVEAWFVFLVVAGICSLLEGHGFFFKVVGFDVACKIAPSFSLFFLCHGDFVQATGYLKLERPTSARLLSTLYAPSLHPEVLYF